MSVQKFKDFPRAFPHFKEEDLPAKRAEARKLKLASRRSLNRKIVESQQYYDLSALKDRSISPTKDNYKKLIRGFISLNFDKYRNKGDGSRKSQFEDKDSRWFGMSRPVVRNIILDEAFFSGHSELAEVPKPEEKASVAEESAFPSWFLPVAGISTALGLAYIVHSKTR